jgi:hypothetical protein
MLIHLGPSLSTLSQPNLQVTSLQRTARLAIKTCPFPVPNFNLLFFARLIFHPASIPTGAVTLVDVKIAARESIETSLIVCLQQQSYQICLSQSMTCCLLTLQKISIGIPKVCSYLVQNRENAKLSTVSNQLSLKSRSHTSHAI